MLKKIIVACYLLTTLAMAAGPFEGVWIDSKNHWLWNFTEKPVWIEGYLNSSSFYQNLYIKKSSPNGGEGTITRTDPVSGARTILNVKITLQDPSHIKLETTAPDGKAEEVILTRKS